MKDTLLTVAQAATLLNLKPSTVSRYGRIGKLRRVKLGYKTVRYRRSELEGLLRELETDKDTELPLGLAG